MMKKTLFILGICLFLLGCVSYQPTPVKINYRLGFDGVNIKFAVFPKQDVYINETIPVQLEIENKGAYDVKNTNVALNYERGFFSTTIQDTNAHLNQNFPILHGRSEAYPAGELTRTPRIDFTAKPIFLTDYQKFNFIAKVCYEYRTEATLEACIGPREGYRSCNIIDLNKNLNLSIGQGAPLAITKVQESIVELGNKFKPRFIILVENKNQGQVFRDPKNNVAPICLGQGLGERVLDRFDLKLNLSTAYNYDSTRTENSFTCMPLVPKLEEGKAEITCTLKEEIETGAAYVAPLVIELVYGYTDKVQEELTVRRT